ncbi:MAG TPA: hypothetical protein VFE33_13945 [Thermoanaerobaculia bacterium]|nr:hypothetical protein [Thermoanaerobaculia bacterium]
MKKTHATIEAEREAGLPWLGDVLWSVEELPQAATVSELFQGRCIKAAQVALDLARLRRERQRVGFVPMAIGDYLRGLGRAIGTDLRALAVSLGIRDLDAADPESVRLVAQLCCRLELPLREALLHLRIAFVERLGAAPMLLARQRSGRGRRESLDECERIMREILTDSGVAVGTELRTLEDELRQAYKEKT